MMLFWLISAVFVAIALAFVIPPLLQKVSKANDGDNKEANIAVYRDQIAELETDLRNGLISQEQFSQDREEIERRVLDDVSASKVAENKTGKLIAGRGPAYLVALGIPIVAIALYMQIGNPAAVSGVPAAAMPSTTAPAPTGPMGQGQMTEERMQANVAALARRLEQNPNDIQGWTMLGRSYATLGKYLEASQAYAKASALKPDDADLLGDYAFTLAMANGQKLQGQPTELVKKALQLDPENPKALELAGSAAFEARDYKQAILYWQKLLAKSPPNSEIAQALTERINKAKELAGSNAK